MEGKEWSREQAQLPPRLLWGHPKVHPTPQPLQQLPLPAAFPSLPTSKRSRSLIFQAQLPRHDAPAALPCVAGQDPRGAFIPPISAGVPTALRRKIQQEQDEPRPIPHVPGEGMGTEGSGWDLGALPARTGAAPSWHSWRGVLVQAQLLSLFSGSVHAQEWGWNARAHPGHGAAGLGLAKGAGSGAVGWKRILANPPPPPPGPFLPTDPCPPCATGKSCVWSPPRQRAGRWRAWAAPSPFPAPCHGTGSFPAGSAFAKSRGGNAAAAVGGKALLWAFTTSDQFHRYSHLSDNALWNPEPSGVPAPQRSPQGEKNPSDPSVSYCCLCSAPSELPLHRPCTAQTSAGSWFTRRGVLASQTSLPVHNTFPAIHNLIYVTIAPINNSVGQLRNYSLKGPELLFLPLPRPICLVSQLRGASCPQVSPARQDMMPSRW